MYGDKVVVLERQSKVWPIMRHSAVNLIRSCDPRPNASRARSRRTQTADMREPATGAGGCAFAPNAVLGPAKQGQFSVQSIKLIPLRRNQHYGARAMALASSAATLEPANPSRCAICLCVSAILANSVARGWRS